MSEFRQHSARLWRNVMLRPILLCQQDLRSNAELFLFHEWVMVKGSWPHASSNVIMYRRGMHQKVGCNLNLCRHACASTLAGCFQSCSRLLQRHPLQELAER